MNAPAAVRAELVFIFKDRRDYDRMMTEINDSNQRLVFGQKVRITGGHLKPGASLADYPRRFSKEQLNAWGFDCLANDLIKGPAYVLAYLCNKANIHTIPVCLGKRQVKHDAVETSGFVQNYVTPEGVHSIIISQYSANGPPTVRQTPLRPATVFRLKFDQELLYKLHVHLSAIKEKKKGLETERDAIKAEEKKISKQIAQPRRKGADKCIARRKKAQQPGITYKSRRTQLANCEKMLEKERALATPEARRVALQHLAGDSVGKRTSCAITHRSATFELAELQIDMVAAKLLHLQADVHLRSMGSAADEKNGEISSITTQFEDIVQQFTKLRDVEKRRKTRATQELELAEKDILATMTKLKEDQPDLTHNEIVNMQQEAEAQLEGQVEIPIDVLHKYEKRAAKIEKLKTELWGTQGKLDVCQEGIDKIKSNWLLKLQALRSRIDVKFCAGMNQLGLNGEVRLANEDPDFDKWGVEILVKFRDKEKLNPLTSYRQSGGERAVATVTYLQALTDFTNSPFGLVDEINHGMDQRFERAIYNALVMATCKDSSDQWFLLTPKLLPNLRTHEKMKFLIINNGLSLPNKLSLKALGAGRVKRNKLRELPFTPDWSL